ncbi:hypothetical protein [Psychrobacillus sp. OK028]|uniref:hypothetical protein n=1 Tax=Psychrobacillus sp. OK028 TaxID=1884359 RepID=UPI0015873D29|nr:hypothetical protein [Psychrobacillus sp. OK028]
MGYKQIFMGCFVVVMGCFVVVMGCFESFMGYPTDFKAAYGVYALFPPFYGLSRY